MKRLNAVIRKLEIDRGCLRTNPCHMTYSFLQAIDENKIILGDERGFPQGHYLPSLINSHHSYETTGEKFLKTC